MEATNKTRENFPLRYLKANEVMFMLGMYLTPDGNNKDQVKYMHKKATAWATSIRSGGIQQNEAWKALNSTNPKPGNTPYLT